MGWGLGALQRTGPRVVGQGLRTLALSVPRLGRSLRGHPPRDKSPPPQSRELLFLPWLFLNVWGQRG